MRRAARSGKHAVAKARRGTMGVVFAAAAAAALAGSGAPGATGAHGGDRGPQPKGPARPFHDIQPPAAQGPSASPSPAPGTGNGHPGNQKLDDSGIPQTVLAAYKKAAATADRTDAGCNLRWELLAGIGKIESGHAHSGALDTAGTTLKPILGPVLDGKGFAAISDTDGGRYDGDTVHDRAVGPMQFIPGTWAKWGIDGNGDGKADPSNVWDATVSAADYLCAGHKDLSSDADLDRAVLSYNNSQKYLHDVKAWMLFYMSGAHGVPDSPTDPGGWPSGSDSGTGPSGTGPFGSGPDGSGGGRDSGSSHGSGDHGSTATGSGHGSSHGTSAHGSVAGSKPAANTGGSITVPKPSAKPSAKPTAKPSPSHSPGAGPSPTCASPSPSPSTSSDSTPKASPDASPSPSSSPSASPSPTPSGSPSPHSTPNSGSSASPSPSPTCAK